MPLAIFDLDNTLLTGDSDYLWGVYLSEIGAVDPQLYERENERFYREYKEGNLDIMEFLSFSLKPLALNSPENLVRWHAHFLEQRIRPLITTQAKQLVERHRAAGDTLLIITATNSFVTRPIAAEFGIPNLIATDPELVNGRYTGRVEGVPSFREGKVTRLQAWLEQHSQPIGGACFYSDSHNDLPLMELVDHPIAVDPDEQLAEHARHRGWPIISLRDTSEHHTAD